MHVVFLDNGRLAISRDPVFSQALRCVRCGSCANVCPIYSLVGGHNYGHVYIGAIGLILTYFYHGHKNDRAIVQNCLNCQACKAICPAGIDLPHLIKETYCQVLQGEEKLPLKNRCCAGCSRTAVCFISSCAGPPWPKSPWPGEKASSGTYPSFSARSTISGVCRSSPTPFRDMWPGLYQKGRSPVTGWPCSAAAWWTHHRPPLGDLRSRQPAAGDRAADRDDAAQRDRRPHAGGDADRRENVNTELRTVLDEATGKWGIRINRVEIKSVDPPADISSAMEKQMRAERDRRAAILTAEGEKQAQILTAEGAKQAAVLTAEGERQAAILRAEGEAKAIDTVFTAIHEGKPDRELLSYEYLQMLPELAEGDAQQGVRDALGVRAGLRRHRRGARTARPGRAAAEPGPAAPARA